MPNLLIKNGLLIDPAGKTERKGDLFIKNGRIAAVGRQYARPSGPVEVCDAGGLWVFPGFIDMHVHAREPGAAGAETLLTASRAAAAGGITSVLLMPNTAPPMDSPALLRRFSARARSRCLVNVFFAAAATAGRAGVRLSPLKELKTAGAAAVTDDGASIPGPALLRVLKAAKALGLPVLDHPEDFRLTGNGVIDESAAARLDLPGISREAEIFAVLRDIFAAGAAGPLHLQHLSCAESVEALRLAKKAGFPVTGETCPHYFSLSSGHIRRPDADFKMKPPLRREADRLAVIRGLADGTIDVIASDHAPHQAEKKALGFLEAPFGIIGLETMVPLALTELVEKGRISRLRLAELLSLKPARILGLKKKGALLEGFDGDITIIDPAAPFRVPQRSFSRSSNSPFIGWRLRGRAEAVIVAGEPVFSGGAARRAPMVARGLSNM